MPYEETSFSKSPEDSQHLNIQREFSSQQDCPMTPRRHMIGTQSIEWEHLNIRGDIHSLERGVERNSHYGATSRLHSFAITPQFRSNESPNFEEYRQPAPQDESPTGIMDHPYMSRETIYQPCDMESLAIPSLMESSEGLETQNMSLPRIRLKPRNSQFYRSF